MLVLLMGLFVIGLLVSSCGTSFFAMWVGLELSTLVTYPWVASTGKSEMLCSSLFKLLVLQVISSAMLYMGVVILWSFEGSWTLSMPVTVVSLYMKFGGVFMGWLAILLESLSWWGVFLVAGLQKLPAMVVLMGVVRSFECNYMVMSGFALAIMGLVGVKMYSTRGFMLASSVLNMGWIWCACSADACLGLSFFLFYVVSFCGVCVALSSLKSQSYTSLFNSSRMTLVECGAFWALSGLPPFALFFYKVDVLYLLVHEGFIVVAGILCMLSATIVYMYMHLILSSAVFSDVSQLHKEVQPQVLVLVAVVCTVMAGYIVFWVA
nr:NADH dehydrogenase subunit 2 [Degeeriella rufa]